MQIGFFLTYLPFIPHCVCLPFSANSYTSHLSFQNAPERHNILPLPRFLDAFVVVRHVPRRSW